MKMDINHYECIYLPIMDEFHPMIIYLIQIINSIHPYEIIHLYGHIPPCRSIKTTLNFKFQAQSSKLKLHVRAQTILSFQHCGLRHLMLLQK
jgi:hypothetical protein